MLLCGVLSAQSYTPHWPEFNEDPWFNYTSVDIKVSVDGVIQNRSSIEVVAFVGDELRTPSDCRFLSPISDDLYVDFLRVYGMENGIGETITFKMWDHEANMGDEDYECTFTVTADFEDHGLEQGDFIVLEFTSKSTEEDLPDYPWTLANTQYNGTCNFLLQLNGVPVTENDRWDLGLFNADGLCRFERDHYMASPFGTNIWTTVVYGEEGEELTFLLYDKTNERYFAGSCDTTLVWHQDGKYGSARSPIIVNFVAPYIFNGTEDNSWNTVDNWREPAVGLPSETDEVTINGLCELDQDVAVKKIIVNNGKCLKVLAGKTLTLTEGFTTTDASQLVLVDDAQLIDAAQTAGKASYMKTVEGYNSNDNNWYILGSPVGTTAIAETDFPTDEYDLYWYDETNLTHEEWKNFKQAQTYSFFPGRGYLYAHDTDYTPSIPGTLSYDNVTFDMTYTDRTYDDLDGLNLLGNPYPFAITIDNFQNDKLTDGFYLLENGAWDSKPSSTPIPTGQGFLIGCTESNTVTFQANTAKSRGTHNSSIEVRIANNNNNTDHAYIVLGEGNDLIKIHHRNDEIPEVFIPKNNKPYAIAHFDRNIESVNLAYHPTIAGQQTLTVKLEGSYEFMTLIDNLTGTKVDMLANNAYTFTAKENDNVNRFTLRFKSNTNVNENTTVNPISYLSNGQLNINGIEGESELQFIDMLGRVVNTTTIHGNYSQKINMTAGVYVVRVINGSNTYTQKIVVE